MAERKRNLEEIRRQRRREKHGIQLMDKSEMKGWRALFDHNRHRNECFLSRYDYRLTLLMITAVDTLSGWNMATFLTVQGFSAIIPLSIITVLFAVPFLFTELFIGGFAGTGLIWSMKNAVPLGAGIGIAMLIQAFLQLVEDIRNVGQLSRWTTVILTYLDSWNNCHNKWHNTEAVEILAGKMFDNPRPYNLTCYPLHGFSRCFKPINSTHTSCGTLSETLMCEATVQFSIYYSALQPMFLGFLDVFHALTIILFLTIFAALASLSFRFLAAYGKYFVFGSFIIQYSVMFGCTMYSRQKLKHGFQDIPFLFSQFQDGLLSYHTWIRSAGLVFRTYGIAHGAMAAVSRRSHQGKSASIFKECLMVVFLTYLSQVVVGFFHILTLPGFTVIKDPFNQRPDQHFFYSLPWLWGTCSYRVLHNDFLPGGRGLILFVLLLQIIKSSGKIIIYYDTVRVGITETIQCRGDFRAWLPAFISVALFTVGLFQFLAPTADAWGRDFLTAYVYKALLAAALTVCITWVYGLKRAFQDVRIVNESRIASKTWLYNVGVVYGKWLLPAILIVSGVSEGVLGRIDPWYRAFKAFGTDSAKIVGGVISGVAFGLFSVSYIYAIVKICQQRRKGLPVRNLLKPTHRWGPCETGFWVGNYRKLRYRYNMRIPLNTAEEKAIILQRRAVRERRISTELDSEEQTKSEKNDHNTE